MTSRAPSKGHRRPRGDDIKRIKAAKINIHDFLAHNGTPTPSEHHVKMLKNDKYLAALFGYQIGLDAPELSKIRRLVMYCDGSKFVDGSGGLAIWFRAFGFDSTQGSPFSGWDYWMYDASGIEGCDIEAIELIAISRALDKILQKLGASTTAFRLFLLSDYCSALEQVEKYITRSPLVDFVGLPSTDAAQLLKPLDDLKAKGVFAEAHYVPAHCGVPGNEKADEYAYKAALCVKNMARSATSQTKYRLIPIDAWISNKRLFNRAVRPSSHSRPAGSLRPVFNVNGTPLGTRKRRAPDDDELRTPASKSVKSDSQQKDDGECRGPPLDDDEFQTPVSTLAKSDNEQSADPDRRAPQLPMPKIRELKKIDFPY
ncbi:hypothetical protein F5Y18DRAFT_438152 [Xylariaceae sp. FL1019]|nr:hypothetical protein F5Y18DRAFT_438152 [Xylariaceae sp. FL1019]